MEPNLNAFKALSDYNRIVIINTLAAGECCACRLQSVLDITQPTLSHHMKVLQQSGIVKMRKKGTCSYYSLDTTTIDGIIDYFDSIRERATASATEKDDRDEPDTGR